MTAPTPEQLRELADALDAGVFRNEELWPDEAQDVENSIFALHTAADQLEAVQELHRWLRKNIGSPALHARLDQFTAGTAPQEGRDE